VRTRLLAQRFVVHREERRIAIHPGIELRATNFTFGNVIANREQVRSGETELRVVLNLFLSQVFHSFSFDPPPRDVGGASTS
jgi:hypothetical protein